MVELEEGGQPLRVVLALLQVLDDTELALDEAEGAQREVDEGVVDRVLQRFQLGGEVGRHDLEFGALEGERLASGDQLGALGLQALEAAVELVEQSVQLAVQGVDGPYDLGELVVAAGVADRFGVVGLSGEAGGADPQDGERLGEGTGHGGGDTDGDQQAATEQRDPQFERGDVVVAQLLQVLDLCCAEGGLDAPHPVDPGGEGRLDLLAAGLLVGLGQLGAVGEGVEVLLRPVDLRPGDGGRQLVAGGGARGLVEVGERGEFADPGLLGGGAQLVTGAVVLAAALVLALEGQPGDRVGLRKRGGTGYGERGEEQPAGCGGLLGGPAERERGAGGLGGARRGLLGEFLGEVEELGNDLGVRLMGGQHRALAAERVAAQGGDGGEVAAQCGRGRFPDLVHPLVDAGAPAAGVALALTRRAGLLAAAGRDVGGDLVTLVGEGVGQRDGLLVQLGEGDQPL